MEIGVKFENKDDVFFTLDVTIDDDSFNSGYGVHDLISTQFQHDNECKRVIGEMFIEVGKIIKHCAKYGGVKRKIFLE